MRAALLNLTGLSLGYLYLGRRRRAVVYLVMTAALVAAAFLTDAASNPWPWQILGGYWILWQVVEGLYLAAADRGPVRRPRAVPVAAGVVLVAAMVAGLYFYGVAGRATYDAGQDAQADGDCVTAIDKYDTVTGPFELTLSDTVSAAENSLAVCHEFLTATVVERFGDHADAIRRYHALRNRRPGDPLLPALVTQLNYSYQEWAHEHRERKAYVQAIDVYRRLLADTLAKPDVPKVQGELAEVYLEEAQSFGKATPPQISKIIDNLTVILTEFPKSPSAAKVPQEIANTLTLASKPLAEGRPCDAVPALDEFAALDPKLVAGVVGQLHVNRAQATYQCGIGMFTGGRYAEAVPMLEAFLASYGTDAASPQARSALIAARVAEDTSFPLSLPPPYAGNSIGPISVTFYNDATTPTNVLLAGATAHEFSLPGCAGCPTDYAEGESGCPTFDGRPSVTLNLNPGLYQWITVRSPDDNISSIADSITVMSGFSHTVCLWVQR